MLFTISQSIYKQNSHSEYHKIRTPHCPATRRQLPTLFFVEATYKSFAVPCQQTYLIFSIVPLRASQVSSVDLQTSFKIRQTCFIDDDSRIFYVPHDNVRIGYILVSYHSPFYLQFIFFSKILHVK